MLLQEKTKIKNQIHKKLNLKKNNSQSPQNELQKYSFKMNGAIKLMFKNAKMNEVLLRGVNNVLSLFALGLEFLIVITVFSLDILL